MSDRKNTFFTSDWHIDHANVLIYSKRPFRDVDHMREVLVNNFNASAGPDSITYFLGDMGLGSSAALRETVVRLNGMKVLVSGNHDKGSEAMYKLGFDVVTNGVSLWIAGQTVTASHCPLLGVWREDMTKIGPLKGENWHGDHKNQRFSFPDFGQFHLHGHIHSPNDGKSQKILRKQMDVGVDANNYRPVSISQIESWITKYGR